MRARHEGQRARGRLAGRLAVALCLAMGLSGCAIPPMITVASFAADGVLLAATGKSKTDHGLSLATGQDCSTFRVLAREDVCQDEVLAVAEPLPVEVERELEELRRALPVAAKARAAPFASSSRVGPSLAVLPAPRPADPATIRQARAAAMSQPANLVLAR